MMVKMSHIKENIDYANNQDKNNFDDNSIQSDHEDTRYMLNFLSLKNLNGF